MPLISADQLPPTAQVFSMQDIEKVARSVLLKAKLQAEQLLASAMAEAERLKEEAREDGRREGFDQGHTEGARHGAEAGRQQAFQQHSAELTTLASTLARSLTQIDAHRTSIETGGTTEVVKLAVAIARRVIKRQVAIDPQVLEANLCEAIKLAVGSADLRIAVHPAERIALQEALPRLKLAWPTLKHVELLDDAGVSPGGCRIFTQHGTIDADLNAQLDHIVADLLPGGAGVHAWSGGAVGDSGSDNRVNHAPPPHIPTTAQPLSPPAHDPPVPLPLAIGGTV